MAQLYSDARQVELGNILAGDNNHMDLFRISVAVSKFFITKRLPQFAYECMEVSYYSMICIYLSISALILLCFACFFLYYCRALAGMVLWMIFPWLSYIGMRP